MKIIMPLVKFGVAGGAIYLAVEEGLFSHSQKETIEAAKRLKTSVSGLDTYEIIPKDLIQFPTSNIDTVGYWNTGVKATTSALASFPSDAAGFISCGILHLRKELQKQLNSSTLQEKQLSSSQEKQLSSSSQEK